ncbi:MAG: amidohydrolase family protein [Cytophagales bacterium]|nr:amidohydrolase family protein [Cytophagales bacterium]
MTPLSPLPPPVLTGLHYRTGRPVEVACRAGTIDHIREGEGLQTAGLPWLGPGLTDLQVNGFRGIDLNAPDLSAADLERLTQELWSVGVTSFLPTLITNHPTATEAALRTIRRACETSRVVRGAVAGIHLEGPFISPEDGPRGAHPKAHVRAPDWALLEAFREASGDRVRLVTLSPEWPGAPELIGRCVAHGIRAAIGHTAATPDQIAAAVAAGASLSTHLGNATHQMLPRHPNYLWEQLAHDDLAASLIADGFHLPDAVLKVAMKVKGDNAMLISDSVSLAGMPPGTYRTHIGDRVVLTADGKLHLDGQPKVLAGSAQPLLWGVQHLLRRNLRTLPQAWDMASAGPNRFMGRPARAGLQPGAPADLVVFTRNGSDLRVLQTYKAGERVFP